MPDRLASRIVYTVLDIMEGAEYLISTDARLDEADARSKATDDAIEAVEQLLQNDERSIHGRSSISKKGEGHA